MAITFTNTLQTGVGEVPSAPVFAQRVDIAFSGTYTTGGDVLDLTGAIGANKTIVYIPDFLLSDGRIAHFDRANAKLQVFEGNGVNPLVETAGSTALSGSGEAPIVSE